MSRPPETVGIFPGRPTYVLQDGWRVCVSVHDASYLRQRAVWRHLIIAAHPDKGGTCQKFTQMNDRYQRWLAAEERWYRTHGLVPPDHKAMKEPAHDDTPKVAEDPAPLLRLARGHQRSKLCAVERYLGQHPAASNDEIALALEVSLSLVRNYRYRLVGENGFARPPSAPQRLLAAMLDRHPHTTQELAAASHIHPTRIGTHLARLRQRGFVYEMARTGLSPCTYRLIGVPALTDREEGVPNYA